MAADPTYVGKVHSNGPDELVVESGGVIRVEAGGSIEVDGVEITDETLAVDGLTASAAELNLLDAVPAEVDFAAAPGAANVCEVTLEVLDAAGVLIAGHHDLEVWLSDVDTGIGLTGTTASGTVTAKTASGTVLGTLTSKKHLRVQTLADGTFILEITDDAKSDFYVCARLLGSPAPRQVSAILETADYGSA